MPKFRVLRPIEHNGKSYLPAGVDTGATTAISGGHGKPVPVDSGGIIELTETEAAQLDLGQIEQIRDQKSETRRGKTK